MKKNPVELYREDVPQLRKLARELRQTLKAQKKAGKIAPAPIGQEAQPAADRRACEMKR